MHAKKEKSAFERVFFYSLGAKSPSWQAKRYVIKDFILTLLNIKEKMTKVAINGFGRIGRLAFRQMFEAEGYEVVAIKLTC